MSLVCLNCNTTHAAAPFLCSGGRHHDWVETLATQEAALAAAVVEAAMAWNQGVEPMGDPEISAECAQRLADDLDSACAALRAFREGRAK
jgi:hypothetical protein